MGRSLAIGGSLTRADTERLLDACAERAAIARILGESRAVMDGARRALNRLAKIVGGAS